LKEALKTRLQRSMSADLNDEIPSRWASGASPIGVQPPPLALRFLRVCRIREGNPGTGIGSANILH
jgi:hypothetical protein